MEADTRVLPTTPGRVRAAPPPVPTTVLPAVPHTVPAFSALVAAWQEVDNITQHIESFLGLGWDHCELIICAGGTDGTLEEARKLARTNVVVLEQRPGQGKQGALRACLERASHDLLYLTDADCVFDRQSLKALLEPVSSGRYEVATGGSRPFVNQLHLALVQYQHCRDAFYFDRQGAQTHGILGRNALITRRCLALTGNFRAEVATGTDYHLSQQLKARGVKIAHAAGSRVQSDYPTTPRSYLRMWRRWIKNLIVHDAKGQRLGVAKSVLLAAALTFAPLSFLALPWPLALPLVLLWPLALRSRYRDLRYAQRRGHRVALRTYLLAPYFVVLDQLAVLGAAFDLVRKGARRQW